MADPELLALGHFLHYRKRTCLQTRNVSVLQVRLISSPGKLLLCKALNTSVYGCFSPGNKLRPRIQIMSYTIHARLWWKAEKKKLSSMSSSKSEGPQTAFLKQHYDNSWCSMGSRVEPGCSCCRDSIFHHDNMGHKMSHDVRSPSGVSC